MQCSLHRGSVRHFHQIVCVLGICCIPRFLKSTSFSLRITKNTFVKESRSAVPGIALQEIHTINKSILHRGINAEFGFNCYPFPIDVFGDFKRLDWPIPTSISFDVEKIICTWKNSLSPACFLCSLCKHQLI